MTAPLLTADTVILPGTLWSDLNGRLACSKGRCIGHEAQAALDNRATDRIRQVRTSMTVWERLSSEEITALARLLTVACESCGSEG